MLRFTTVYTHKVLIVNLDAQFRSQGNTIKRIWNKNSVRWNGFDSWKSSLTFPICKQTTENHSHCSQQPTRLFSPERSLKPSPLPFWRTNPKVLALNFKHPETTSHPKLITQFPESWLQPVPTSVQAFSLWHFYSTPHTTRRPYADPEKRRQKSCNFLCKLMAAKGETQCNASTADVW